MHSFQISLLLALILDLAVLRGMHCSAALCWQSTASLAAAGCPDGGADLVRRHRVRRTARGAVSLAGGPRRRAVRGRRRPSKRALAEAPQVAGGHTAARCASDRHEVGARSGYQPCWPASLQSQAGLSGRSSVFACGLATGRIASESSLSTWRSAPGRRVSRIAAAPVFPLGSEPARPRVQRQEASAHARNLSPDQRSVAALLPAAGLQLRPAVPLTRRF